MERLTCPAQGYCEMYCKEYGRCFGEPETCDFSKEVQLYEKLRDYESSYLEPLEVRILERAKKEGRLVVLPCKVGDTVWFIRPLERKKEITETTVEKIVTKEKGLYIKLACNAMYETSCNSIGKTVFLTREEAEAALKGGNRDA